LHDEKPGQISLVRDKSLFKVNIDDQELSNFLNTLVNNLISNDGKLDFFIPLGCSVDGIELMNSIQQLTGVLVRAPAGFIRNYNYGLNFYKTSFFFIILKFGFFYIVKSKWLNCSSDEIQPEKVYFESEKLKKWIYSCELFNELNNNLNSLIQSSYADCLDKQHVENIVGKLVYDKLVNISLINDSKISNKLVYMISKAANKTGTDFFESLLNELKKYHLQNAHKEEEKENVESLNQENNEDKKKGKGKNDEPEKTFESDEDHSEVVFKTTLKSDEAIKGFIMNVNNTINPCY
jgi:hypothetical protein